MNAREQRQYCLDIIRTCPACCLATLDDRGEPEIRAMVNLKNETLYPGLRSFFSGQADDFTVFFSTNTSSPKRRQISRNPAAAIYYCLPELFQGVMLKGTMEIVADAAVKRSLWQPDWTTYYPGGVNDPDYTVLRLRPGTVKAYRSLSTFTFTPGAV